MTIEKRISAILKEHGDLTFDQVCENLDPTDGNRATFEAALIAEVIKRLDVDNPNLSSYFVVFNNSHSLLCFIKKNLAHFPTADSDAKLKTKLALINEKGANKFIETLYSGIESGLRKTENVAVLPTFEQLLRHFNPKDITGYFPSGDADALLAIKNKFLFEMMHHFVKPEFTQWYENPNHLKYYNNVLRFLEVNFSNSDPFSSLTEMPINAVAANKAFTGLKAYLQHQNEERIKKDARNRFTHFKNAGAVQSQGDKGYQEDRCCSQQLSNKIIKRFEALSDNERQRLLWNVTVKLQEKFGTPEKAAYSYKDKAGNTCKAYTGTTAIITLRIGQKVYYANVGDSEAYFVKVAADGTTKAQRLHPIHSANPRLCDPVTGDHTNLSRSIGDPDFEKLGLSHTPDVGYIDCALADGETGYLIHSSDGIRDGLQESMKDAGAGDDHIQRIGELVNQAHKEKKTPLEISKLLTHNALNKKADPISGYTADNITVITQEVTSDSARLDAVFDGHGGEGLAGEALVSAQCAKAFKATFGEELQKVLKHKKENPNTPFETYVSDGVRHFPNPSQKKRQKSPSGSPELHKRKRTWNYTHSNDQDFPTYGVHLSSHHPIKADELVMWDLTPRCYRGNNGFGIESETDEQYKARVEMQRSQIEALCEDHSPKVVLLQNVGSLHDYTPPQDYHLIKGANGLVTLFDTRVFQYDEEKSLQVLQAFQPPTISAALRDRVLFTVLVNKNKELTLFVNVNLNSDEEIQPALTCIENLKDALGLNEIKIAGNFNRNLQKDKTIQGWDIGTTIPSSVTYNVQSGQRNKPTIQDGILSKDEINVIDVLDKYNTSKTPAARYANGIGSGHYENCLNHPDKKKWMQMIWESLDEHARHDKAYTPFGRLEETTYKHQAALQGTIDGHKIIQANSGYTHIESVTALSAQCALQLHLTARLLIEVKDKDGKITIQRPEADKSKDGKLLFPKGHPQAGTPIVISIVKCESAAAQKTLQEAAVKMGFTIENAKAPVAKQKTEKAQPGMTLKV